MKTKYFKTYDAAKAVADTLGPYEPSRYLSAYEVARGAAKVKINEFDKGFAIQLGDYGTYYPNTQNIQWQDMKE